MSHPCGGACLAQETKPSRFITQMPFVNDLQGHWAVQIDIERLIGDAHRPATQLYRSAILV
jgi:hypothetical protein